MRAFVRCQGSETRENRELLFSNQHLTARERLDGFTLLEIMIALAIIGITLAVVLHTVNYHAEIMYQSTITTRMYQMAKEKMYDLEKSHANASGSIDTVYTFENRASQIEGADIIKLRTTVTGQDKEVSLTELIVKKNNQFGGQGSQ